MLVGLIFDQRLSALTKLFSIDSAEQPLSIDSTDQSVDDNGWSFTSESRHLNKELNCCCDVTEIE